MANPEAIYDALFIVRRLGESLHGVTEGEVHLFAYLARLLGLFRGAPSADWGYMFARTSWGAPYSREIADAIEELELSGRLREAAQGTAIPIVCTEEGRALTTALAEFESLGGRRPCLDAACSSASAFPVVAIRQAISSEPTLRSASGHVGPQELLAGPSLGLLYEQFGALRDVLDDAHIDLLVPSAVWLTYLIENGSSSEEPARD